MTEFDRGGVHALTQLHAHLEKEAKEAHEAGSACSHVWEGIADEVQQRIDTLIKENA